MINSFTRINMYILSVHSQQVQQRREAYAAFKGDHKHIRGAEFPYAFQDVPTLVRDFMQDVEEIS